MTPRMNYYAAAPKVLQAMLALTKISEDSGLEHSLLELVKIRASQINGCAFCIHMHSRDAIAAGETAERLLLLDAWRESPLFTDRERAALAWTESLTLIAQTRAPDEDYDMVKAQFSDAELVNLTLAITTINAWNRFSVGFRSIHPVSKKNAA